MLWKDRVAEEKKLAYGAFFNEKQGYISPEFYSIFLDAFRPKTSMKERYESGKLGLYEWKFRCLLTNETDQLVLTNTVIYEIIELL